MLHLIGFGLGVVFFVTLGFYAVYLFLCAVIPPLLLAVGVVFRFAYACIPFAILAVIVWVAVQLLWAGRHL
jgi:hypothetical protein